MKPIMLNAVLALAAAFATAASAAPEEWNSISHSAQTAYLADIGGVSTVGDDTTVRIAMVPLNGAAGDYSHGVSEVVLRCGANQTRTVLEIEYGPDGAEVSRYEDPEAAWDSVTPNSLSGYIKNVACEGQRTRGANAASIKAFIDGGRGK